MGAFASPAFWASLGVILASIGIEVPGHLFEDIVATIAGIAGIIGVVSVWLGRERKKE